MGSKLFESFYLSKNLLYQNMYLYLTKFNITFCHEVKNILGPLLTSLNRKITNGTNNLICAANNDNLFILAH